MQHISRRSLAVMLAVASLTATLSDDVLAPAGVPSEAPPRGRHAAPFAKREEGRQRRLERKGKAVRRWAWLEG